MVYVTQECFGKNLLPAREYGAMIVLLGPQQLVLDTSHAIAELKEKLFDFNDKDFILPVGDPVAIGLAAAIAAGYNQGKVAFLKWDRQEQRYYSVQSTIGKDFFA